MHSSEQSPANLILPTDLKTARIRLIGMGCAYAMGTFNDNFFKQVALLLAVEAGLHAIQGGATLLFALPFVLFSAWAGWPIVCPKRTSSWVPSFWNWRPCSSAYGHC